MFYTIPSNIAGNNAALSYSKDRKEMPGASVEISRRHSGGKATSISGIFLVNLRRIPDDGQQTLTVPRICTVLWIFFGAELGVVDNAAYFSGSYSKDKKKMPGASFRIRRVNGGKTNGGVLFSKPLHIPADERQTASGMPKMFNMPLGFNGG